MTVKGSQHVWFLDVVHEALCEALDAAGMTCHDGTSVSREALMQSDLGPVHGLVLRSRIRLDAEVLHALPDLQWVARSGSGLENIDLATAAELGVAVGSVAEGFLRACVKGWGGAELAVGSVTKVFSERA